MVFPQIREGGGGGEGGGRTLRYPLFIKIPPLATEDVVYPLTPTSDRERTYPYIIHTVSSRQVMRIEKNNSWGSVADPIPNSPNEHYKNYIADSKENYSM